MTGLFNTPGICYKFSLKSWTFASLWSTVDRVQHWHCRLRPRLPGSALTLQGRRSEDVEAVEIWYVLTLVGFLGIFLGLQNSINLLQECLTLRNSVLPEITGKVCPLVQPPYGFPVFSIQPWPLVFRILEAKLCHTFECEAPTIPNAPPRLIAGALNKRL